MARVIYLILRSRFLHFTLNHFKFNELKKRYWGNHLWLKGYFCGNVGTVIEEIAKPKIQERVDL
jgi:REP element-mobilizing transposase RayT